MRLADSFRSERFGAVRIHELQRVIELDSGAVLSRHPGFRLVVVSCRPKPYAPSNRKW